MKIKTKDTQSSQAGTTPNKHSRLLALCDLLWVMGTMVIVKQISLPVTFMYAGPASTFSAMAVATFLLRKRGLNWSALGLKYPKSWLKTLALTALTFICFVVAMQLTSSLADLYFTDVDASGRFDHIKGNLIAYLITLFLVWTHASFFEELLFRAFIIHRASHVFGDSTQAKLIAVLISAVFFGYRHYYYQGMHGALTTGAAGIVFASLYLWFGKNNILPLVLSHGIVNTLSQTFRYLGIEPD